MKLKMKLMAAAIALTAATGANAAMDNFASGNGSLAFIALDSTGSPISFMADLDYNLTGFLPTNTNTAGLKIQWDFSAQTLKTRVGNDPLTLVAGTERLWSSAFSTFAGTAQTAETKWAVISGDSLTDGTPGTSGYLTTAAPGTTLASLQLQTKANLAGFSGVDSLYNANNLLQSASNASTETVTTSGAYVGNNGAFGTAGKWENKFVGVAFANVGATADFFKLDTNNGTSSTRALVTPYAGDFTYAAGVLTYEVAPIPEPETYALLLAGLGMLGFMGRRRLNNRA